MAPYPSKRPYDGSNYGSSKRYRTQSYVPAPMIMTSSSFKQRSNTSRKSYGSTYRKGPYRVLTGGQRHTNPVYPKPECKIYDTDVAAASPPTSTLYPITNVGVVSCVNTIPTGTGVGGFTGNQVSIKSAAYRFELDLGTTPVATSGRVLLIWDKQPNGALAAFTDIFAFPNYLSFANVNTRERFVILRNDQFSLSPQGDQSIFIERFVKINMTTTFTNNSAGTVPQTGALLIVFIADQATAANQPRIAGNIRVRYYDN